MARSQSSSLARSTSPSMATPALFTRMCRPPSAATISLIAASTAAESATSKRWRHGRRRPPRDRGRRLGRRGLVAGVVERPPSRRARPSATAMARPMPRDPPVTRPRSVPSKPFPSVCELPIASALSSSPGPPTACTSTSVAMRFTSPPSTLPGPDLDDPGRRPAATSARTDSSQRTGAVTWRASRSSRRGRRPDSASPRRWSPPAPRGAFTATRAQLGRQPRPPPAPSARSGRGR